MNESRSTKEGNLDNPLLAEHADTIRAIGKRVVSDVNEIGRRLKECKKLLGHGNWLPWLKREFGWTNKTAENFIRVHDLAQKAKIENFSNLSLPVSGLYLLAAPSTPAEAREEIIERAGGGEKVSIAEIKKTITKTKPPKSNKPTAAAVPATVEPTTPRASVETSATADARPDLQPEASGKTDSTPQCDAVRDGWCLGETTTATATRHHGRTGGRCTRHAAHAGDSRRHAQFNSTGSRLLPHRSALLRQAATN